MLFSLSEDLWLEPLVLSQSREQWSPLEHQLDTCLGERTRPSQQQQQQHLLQQHQQHEMMDFGTTLEGMSPGNQDVWRESFQDLKLWCPLPPPQDEINTPQITLEDLIWKIDGSRVHDLDTPSSIDMLGGNPWGGDMSLKSQSLDLDDSNNYSTMKLTDSPSYYNKSYSSVSPIIKSESGNVLLSQGILHSKTTYSGKTLPQHVEPTLSSMKFKPMDLNDGLDYEETLDFKTPEEQIRSTRPKLSLNIPVPTTSSTATVLSTPEVMKTLVSASKGFDLVSYVDCDFSANTVPTVPQNNESVSQDHDYSDPKLLPVPPTSVIIKTEPLSPEPRGRAIKRKRDSSSDYNFDSDASEESEDSWMPSSSSKKKKERKGSRPISVRSVDSDVESVFTSADKYRELRDKNNLASRRSRLNRKQRDIEMKKLAAQLERENIALKAKAERMDKLVAQLRQTILHVIKTNK